MRTRFRALRHLQERLSFILIAGLVGIVLLSSPFMIGSPLAAQEKPAYTRLVQTIYTGRFGVTHPVGLAFSPGANALLLLDAQSATQPAASIALLTTTRGSGRQPQPARAHPRPPQPDLRLPGASPPGPG